MFKKLLANKKSRNIFIMVIVAAAAAAVYLYINAGEKDVQPTVKSSTVNRGDIVLDFIGDGNVDLPVTNLSFQVQGQLKEVLAEVGQDVKQGEVLARLDDTDYSNELAKTRQEYQLKLISEKNKLASLKNQLDLLEMDYQSMLETSEFYSAYDLEQKRVDYESSKADYETELESYDIYIEQADTAIKTAQDNLNDTVLVSPADARVMSIDYKVGETIPDDETFLVLSDSGKIRVVTQVSEVDITQVYIEQKVKVVFDALEGQTYTGKVVYIDSLGEIDNSGLVSYEVKVDLDDSVEEVKDNMTCTLSFIIKEINDAIIIPNKAVTMENGKEVVQVQGEDGTTENRVVKTGFSDGTNVEVTEGLEVGEAVLVRI